MVRRLPCRKGRNPNVARIRSEEDRDCHRSGGSVPVPIRNRSIALCAQESVATVTVNWNKVDAISKTTPTLQVVVNPMLRPGSPIVANSYAAVRDLGADFVRYVPWLPYPKLGVAELTPPTSQSTSWDFSLIDPMTIDFLNATKGHSTILNFSTIPQWMFKTDKPVEYPSDPNQVDLDLHAGNGVAGSFHEGARRLLCAAGQLVHEGRIHR